MKQYIYDEVFQSTLKYFKGDDLAAKVFINKYCLKDKFKNLYELNPDDMHWRIAREIARIEYKYINPLSEREVYDLLKDFKYIIPQGSPMSGIGNNFQITSISNCFVIGNNEDSYGSIMKIDEEQVYLMKRRGGVGHDLSHLRPDGSETTGAANTSTGVVTFAERYSNTTREVGQDGRRGALMLSLDVRHPDIMKFIQSKLDKKKITGANISIKIFDEFMEALENNQEIDLRFPIDSKNSLISKKIEAKEIWDKLIYSNWKSAEPGILFWDNIINESPANKYGEEWMEVSTNPCGELPLCPYDSCRLLAINIYSYVENPFTDLSYFNYDKFMNHVKIAQRIMDDIVDLEIEKIDNIISKIKSDPESEETKKRELDLWNKIRNKCVSGRRTGLGITAEGDMLAALGFKYGTEQATQFSESIHRILAIESYKSSIELAQQRGAFPIWNNEKDDLSPFVQRVLGEIFKERNYQDLYNEYGRRNISNLTIAPTGTTSLMAQTSSGIEPVFQLYYKRRVKVNPTDDNVRVDYIDDNGDRWMEFKVFHPKFIDFCRIKFGIDNLHEYSDEKIKEFIELSPYNNSCANDIDWEEKVRMQGEIQRWVDHSISVTINLPKETTEQTIDILYRKAWKSGCKGLTIYREGSRSGVLINNEEQKFEYRDKIKRPKILKCDIHHPIIKGDKYLVLVGLFDDKPFEIFGMKNNTGLLNKYSKGELIKVKSGRYDLKIEGDGIMENIGEQFERPLHEYATRLMSWGLSTGSSVKRLVEQLEKAPSESLVDFNKVMARVLKKYVQRNGEKTGDKCPECGDDLIFREGCIGCKSCTYSKCG